MIELEEIAKNLSSSYFKDLENIIMDKVVELIGRKPSIEDVANHMYSFKVLGDNKITYCWDNTKLFVVWDPVTSLEKGHLVVSSRVMKL